jgi:hypothetical protein
MFYAILPRVAAGNPCPSTLYFQDTAFRLFEGVVFLAIFHRRLKKPADMNGRPELK